jgi:hypothetical protein
VKNKQQSNKRQFDYNNVSTQRVRKEPPCPLPTPMTCDELSMLLDDELVDRFRSLDNDREKVIAVKFDATPWETEICYVRREMQLRRIRREHHDLYLKQLDREADEAFLAEDKYPVADLDNSSFMFIN